MFNFILQVFFIMWLFTVNLSVIQVDVLGVSFSAVDFIQFIVTGWHIVSVFIY